MRRKARCRLRRGTGFRIVRLRAASLEGRAVLPGSRPLAFPWDERVRGVCARFSALASFARWNPGIIMRIPALANLTCVLMIIPRATMAARSARGNRSILWCSRIPPWCRVSRLGLRHLIHINWESEQGSTLLCHAPVMVIIRELIIRVKIAALETEGGCRSGGVRFTDAA